MPRGRSRGVTVQWRGLDEFKDRLRAMDAEMTAEANEIMVSVAESARTAIVQTYPIKSGNLRRGVIIRKPRNPGRLLAGVDLVQRAPHGWLYERGTTVRHNKKGANRGQMKATPTFVPIAERYHRAGIDAIIRRLDARGATRVTRNGV